MATWKLVIWSQPASLPQNSLPRNIEVVKLSGGVEVVAGRYNVAANRFEVASGESWTPIAPHQVTRWSSTVAPKGGV